MTSSAPRLAHVVEIAVLQVVMTRAPMCLASWMAKPATPPAPPWIRMVSPALSFSESSTAQIAVRPVSASAAASTWDSAGWLLADDGGADSDLLAVGSVAARLQHAEHLVADLEVLHARTDGAHHAGEIAAQDHGERGLLVVAGRHLRIGAVDARGHGVDDDLARPGDRIGKIAVLQDFRSAEFLDVSSLHGVPTFAMCRGKK